MNRNQREDRKQQFKLAVRRWLPNWFLKLVRRRQVPLKPMQRFLAQFSPGPKLIGPAKTIAVVIPCYRHDQYLPEALLSLTKQTRQPEQIILVNDHSPDQTSQILNAWQQKQSNPATQIIILNNDKNLGQAASLNRAIQTAQTDLVMILNDDDCLLPDTIETVLALFARYPHCALLGGSNINLYPDQKVDWSRTIQSQFPLASINLKVASPAEALAYEDYCSLNMTHSGSTFYKQAALAAGLYWPKGDRIVKYSDRDFQIRLNLLYPVGTSEVVPLSYWRNYSSVDNGNFT